MNKPKIFNVTPTPKGREEILTFKPEVAKETYCACINVSDSPCASFDYQLHLPSFWFPINEIGKWQHSPFFGALRVVNEYFKGDKPVLIHCHAGANRSPSIAFAILIAKGYTVKEAEESLKYPNLNEVFNRNIERNHIPKNIIEFLKIANEHPEYSLSGVLRKMDSLFEEFAQRKFEEQNNYLLSGNAEQATSLVYDKETKKYVVIKNNG